MLLPYCGGRPQSTWLVLLHNFSVASSSNTIFAFVEVTLLFSRKRKEIDKSSVKFETRNRHLQLRQGAYT